MEVALIIFALLAIGAVIAWSRAKTQLTKAREALVRAETEQEAHANSVDREVEERKRVEVQRDDLQAKLSASEAQFKAAVAERDTERKNHEQRLKELDERFKGLAADIFKSNSEEFRKQAQENFLQQRELAVTDLEKRQVAVDNLVKPVGETLEKLEQRVGEIEKAREGAYAQVHEIITNVQQQIGQLSTETGSLREALRSSNVRGYWGEQELRNIIEFAGMTEHVSFVTQETTTTLDEASDIRPDLIVNIPGGVRVVVDSKTPFEAYFEARNTKDPDTQQKLLDRHASALMGHARELKSRDYSHWVKGSPDFVVMFIGADGILDAALDTRPALWEEAWQQHNVLIATPLNLIAFLRTVALAWREQRLQENARNISDTAAELYDRFRIYLEHVNRVGVNLNKAVDAHNKSVRSLNRTVFPHTRKLEDRGITKGKDIPQIDELAVHPETLTAPELSETPRLEAGD